MAGLTRIGEGGWQEFDRLVDGEWQGIVGFVVGEQV